MATGFGVDSDAARTMSQQLAQVRADMQGLDGVLEAYRGASGSARVEGALESFFKDSSDYRGAMDSLLKRASGLLQGLADGTAAVDGDLATALTDSGEPSSGPTPQRTGAPQ